jgi:hypothetical protein
MNPYGPYAPPTAGAPPQTGMSGAAPAAGLSELALEMLRQTRPWVIFMGVLMFVGSALMFVMSIVMMGVGLAASAATKNPATAAIGFVYLPLALIYIYPGLKMVKYGSAIGRLMESRSSADLEDALTQQKSLWKFSGIAAIVMIVLYVLIIVVAVVAVGVGMSAALGGH